jgi:hypothetical protein
MARKSLQRAGGQPPGRSRHCAILLQARAKLIGNTWRECWLFPESIGKLLTRSTSPLCQRLRRRALRHHHRAGKLQAAYNAGPQRVQDWLSARGGLPKETRRYVQIVTGHSADEWTGGTNRANLELPEPMPCREVPKVGFRTAAKSDSGIEKAAANSSFQVTPGWGVQLVGSPPKPLHWRHFNNYRSRTRDFWNRASHSLFNPKSERAVPGIACVSLPTVVPTLKNCVPVSARQAAPAWCSAIDPASVASCYSPSWPYVDGSSTTFNGIRWCWITKSWRNGHG